MLWFFFACLGDAELPDLDADGFDASIDCDDNNASVNPDADEVCNGVDDDCSGEADGDASDLLSWFADTDGDGFGDSADVVEACEAPVDFVADSTDCDDATPLSNPGAVEDCDSDIDEDCDGEAACI